MNSFRRDFLASLVVFVIALPLSLGIAMASGASLEAGLISAIVGGIVVGALAGAPLTVTGPAAGLTALVFGIVQTHGLSGLAVIGFLAGLIQIGMAVLRGGRFFHLLPKSTLEGVLTAIGLIIVLGQAHVLLGGGVPGSSLSAIVGAPRLLSGVTFPILFCATTAIGTLLLWRRSSKLNEKVPAALAAVVVATIASLPFDLPRVEVAALGPHAREGFALFWNADWGRWLSYLAPAFGLAIVASAESLLTAKAVVLLAETKRRPTECKLDRELLAQGVGNCIVAPLGGIPMTAVMVRSAANVNSGATSRRSTVMHGIWIALFVGAFAGVLRNIPLSALAAVLVITGLTLVNLGGLLDEWRKHRAAAAHWAMSAAAVVAFGLLEGLVFSIVAYYVATAYARAFRRDSDRAPTPG